MFPSVNSSGTELFLDSLVSIDPLHRDFGDVVLHGGSVGVHDRNAGIGRMLGLAYESGILGSAVRQVFQLRSANLNANLVGGVALTTALLAVLMIAFCGRHWMKEHSGLGKARSTFLVSLGIVAVYYATLLQFFWGMIPNA
jgi:hypothetical protein